MSYWQLNDTRNKPTQPRKEKELKSRKLTIISLDLSLSLSHTHLTETTDGKQPRSINMDECGTDHTWAHRLGCILFYGGQRLDIAINYPILAMNLWCLRREPQILPFCGFVTVFQISLCWAVGCSGISIIWCACAGWALQRDGWHITTSSTPTVIAVDTLAIFYYAITAEPITTLAHGCAIALGALLKYCMSFSPPSSPELTADSHGFQPIASQQPEQEES